MYVPSLRRCSLRCRTITHLTTVPFLAVPSGAASLTAAVTTSPRPAFSPVCPPRGRIICSRRAPLLSATSRIVLIMTAIIFSFQAHQRLRLLRPRAFRAHPPLARLRLGFFAAHQLGLLNHVLELPALQLGQRPAFFDLDKIADPRSSVFIVRVELLRFLNDPAIERVRFAHTHFNHDGLAHFGGNHLPDLGTAAVLLVVCCCGLCHLLLPRFACCVRSRQFFFAHDGFHSGHVFAQAANFLQAFCLSHLELELKTEELVVEVTFLLSQLGISQVSNFFCIHSGFPIN